MTLNRSIQPSITDFPPLFLPELSTKKLSNDLSLTTLQGGDVEVNRFTMSFTGGSSDTDNPARLAILGALLREGTTNYTGQQISQHLDYEGAWLKIIPDRHSLDITLHSVNASLTRLLPILNDIVDRATLPESEFMTIRERMASMVAVKETKVTEIAGRIYMRLMFGENHPLTLSTHTSTDFLSVTREHVVQAYETIIKQGKPKMFVAGMTEGLDIIIDKGITLSPGHDNNIDKRLIPAQTCLTPIKVIERVKGAQQSAVIIAFKTIPRSHPDYIDLRLAVLALGGYFGSRLMKEIREEQGLTYGINASLLGYREGAVIKIEAQTDAAYVDRLIDSTWREIVKLQTEPITDQELASLKAHAMSSLASVLDSPFTVMDYHLTMENIGEDPTYFTRQQEAIKRLTTQRIMSLFRQYINPDDAITVIAGP